MIYEALQPFVCQRGPWRFVAHPLVHMPILDESSVEMINLLYRQKLTQVARARETKNWSYVIMLHERPYRLSALCEIMGEVDDATFWSLVAFVWRDSENIFEGIGIWREVWSMRPASRHMVMSTDEQKALAALPERVAVYRGIGPKGEGLGMSWTTDRAKARWFAERFGHPGRVLVASVPKTAVLAYFLGRGESEVVTFPESIEGQTRSRVR